MVDVKTMTKEQYLAWREEKNDIDKGELLEMWMEFEEDAKVFGIDTNLIDTYIKQRFSQAFAKKALRRGADPEKFKVIITGISTSDFGAGSAYKKAMKVLETEDENKINQAIQAGILNSDRQPIFPPETKLESKRGKVINLEDENQTNITVISKRVDVEDKFKLGKIQIQTKQLKKMPTLFSINEVELVPGKNCTPELDVLYGNDTTRFKEEKILSEDKVEELFNNFFQKYIFDMGQLSEVAQNYPDPEAGKYDHYVLVKANVVDINITGENASSNMLTIIDSLNEDAVASVWLPKVIPVNFDYRAQNIWVYGTVSWNSNDNIPVINGVSVYIPEQFRINGEAKPVTPEVPKEEVPAPKMEVSKDIDF